MDTNIIISVLGTLAGTGIGAYAIYLAQSKMAERNRRWSLEDEKKRIKRESLSNRLNLIEEAIHLRMYLANLTMKEDFGDDIYANAKQIKEKKMRLEEISNEAWTYVKATGSKDFKKWYRAISVAYRKGDEQGTIPSEDWKTANSSLTKITRLIDEMKAKIE